jgi:hypothetical protein
VSFSAGSTDQCTISGSTVTITGAGFCTVTASQAGNGNYNVATDVSRTFSIAKANQAINFAAPSDQFIGTGGLIVSATGGGSPNPVTFSTSTPAICTSGGTNGATVSFVGLGPCTVIASQAGNANYNAAPDVGRSFRINPDPTTVQLDLSRHSLIDFDCVTNVIAATITDQITQLPIQGATVTLTIGTQSAIATTNSNGVASAAIVLNQPTGLVQASASYGGDGGIHLPKSVSQQVTIGANPNVGPGQNATSLYTGSLYFWTTSSTSSTATLTLSTTVKGNSAYCTGDITKAKVSFFVSTNGTSWSPVSSAQNLPVGLVNPNDPTVGTASAISQYNIGNSQSVTLFVRVVVGGQYTLNTSQYDSPITIGKPGQVNSLYGGGRLLNNDKLPYPADGYLGLNSISSEFGSQVTYNKSGTNPQGQVTVYIRSCNNRDGSVDPLCDPSKPATWHVYFIKSNSISELSLRNGSASFGSKTNVYEQLPDGSKVGLDGGGTMQIVFTPYGQTIPSGMYVGTNATCTNQMGCAALTAYKSTGGVWYSSAWGQGPGTTAPHTYIKNVVNGNLVVQ